jgi:hypothetical protein
VNGALLLYQRANCFCEWKAEKRNTQAALPALKFLKEDGLPSFFFEMHYLILMIRCIDLLFKNTKAKRHAC